jgi:hypothetical protein
MAIARAKSGCETIGTATPPARSHSFGLLGQLGAKVAHHAAPAAMATAAIAATITKLKTP